MAERLLMLALSPTMEEGVIVKWIKQVGEGVSSGDTLCEVEADKAIIEYQALDEGVLLKITAAEGESTKVGDMIGVIGEAGEDISELLEQAAKEPKAQTAVAQRALEEEADIEVLAPERLVTATIKVTEKRRMIAERLSESKYLAPHYYLKISVLVDGLLNERKMFNKSSEQKLSFNSYMMKICAETMKKHPRVNATWQGDTIGMRDQVDIALAVAQPDGLITPVVRDCGSKGIVVIDKELKVLIDKTRKGVLTPPEYTNSTFTITNLGGFGIDEFTAIINPPNSAILAMGAALKQPVVGDDGGIEVRTVMKLTLSCDHRLIDGVVGAMFLSDLKYRIEYPIEGWY